MVKTVIVTGGTDGIGRQTAIGLAKLGMRVVVTGRDLARGEQGVDVIKSESGNNDVHLALGDLSSVPQVKTLAADLRSRFPVVDILINNGGGVTHERVMTEGGFEHTFALNVVASYLLTTELLPNLMAATSARVINVTGGAPLGGLDVGNLQAEQSFSGMMTYSRAKRALEAMSLGLAKELEPKDVYLNIVYPGGAKTPMNETLKASDLPGLMKIMWPIMAFMMKREDGGKSAGKAALSSIYAATSDEFEQVSGRYLNAKVKPATFHPSVNNTANQKHILDIIRTGLQTT